MQRRSAASLLRIILAAGVVAGTLDGLAAVVNYLAVGGKDPLKIFHYIASGVFGQDAISGNDSFALLGLLFHYTIATGWAALYTLAWPVLARWSQNRVVNGVVYGIVVWAVMNLVVVPLSNVPGGGGGVHWPRLFLPMGILIVCVGLPIAFIAGRRTGAAAEAQTPRSLRTSATDLPTKSS